MLGHDDTREVKKLAQYPREVSFSESCGDRHVVTVMATAFESSATGEELGARLRGVVQSWWAAGSPLMQACQTALSMLSAPVRDKLERMNAS